MLTSACELQGNYRHVVTVAALIYSSSPGACLIAWVSGNAAVPGFADEGFWMFPAPVHRRQLCACRSPGLLRSDALRLSAWPFLRSSAPIHQGPRRPDRRVRRRGLLRVSGDGRPQAARELEQERKEGQLTAHRGEQIPFCSLLHRSHS